MPEAAEFDALTAEFYEGWLHYHPDLALRAGVPVAGRLLPVQEDEDLVGLKGWLEELLLGLDEIDFHALDADRQLDWELLAGAARVEHRELCGGGWRRRDPLGYLPLAELEWLSGTTDAAPHGTLARLLGELPEHLRQAQVQLRVAAPGLGPLLVRVAAREAQRACEHLRALARGPRPHRDAGGHVGLAEPLESAAAALAGYHHFLTAELAPRARGALGRGVEHLGLRLCEVHFIDCDPAAGCEPITRALERASAALSDADATAGQAPLPADGGYHLAATDAARGHRLPRRFANDASWALGRQLYLGRRGAQGAPGPRLAESRELLLLAQLDLDLHRGRIDDKQALASLARLGLEGPAAEARVAQVARHPGDALAGVLGWRLLEQVRDRQGADAGPGAPAWRALLASYGAIPLPLVLRYGLGQAAWQAAWDAVLGT
ncbi:hypothetical protein [Candidatus Thiodictyon syntrophicum]|jgi:hypothetical protein|uniref:DUF885 domain-containing protein n=1 Tax=Candidatus Thiodictyon syntrophicum TaxID=1166950 RepID=A0A2K8UEU2_9GAMM|nr:hypothetical protein [Candidatus Thiodictyon syntrophicum]AUB84093.1 hypothetical protein THSYN_26255 [Candidatus Thiodictyon syntrophicum]